MTKQEAPLQQLKQYLPEGSFDEVSDYLEKYKVQLTITRERKTLLGTTAIPLLVKATGSV
jgi:hypothetical protein